MGFWKDDYMTYMYTKKQLMIVADNYKEFISLCKTPRPDETPKRISHDALSTKVDFDRAVDNLGKGHWDGTEWFDYDDSTQKISLNDYKGFGNMQLVVISDILGHPDSELEVRGLTDIDLLRDVAYKSMARFLNKGE